MLDIGDAAPAWVAVERSKELFQANWDSGCVSNTSVPRRQCQPRVLPTLRRSYCNLRAPVCRQRLRVALAKPTRLPENGARAGKSAFVTVTVRTRSCCALLPIILPMRSRKLVERLRCSCVHLYLTICRGRGEKWEYCGKSYGTISKRLGKWMKICKIIENLGSVWKLV